MSRQLNIIIPYYNGQDVIEACLKSIRVAAKNISYKIIIVNNSVEKCNVKSSSDLKIIETKKSIGFGRACNIGVYKNLDANYFMIINQDALISENAIHKFIKVHKSLDREDVLLSPFLKNYRFTKTNHIFNNLTINRNQNLKSDVENNELKESYEINFASGACLFFSKHFVERFHLFDPSFFMYGEDDDLCHRVLSSGSKIILVSHAIVGHDSGFEQSTESIKSLRRVYKRNANYLLRLKYPEKYTRSANTYKLRSIIKSIVTLKIKNLKAYLAFEKQIKATFNLDLETKISNQIEKDLIA
jgi:GT2 family glycosyltransferase